MGRITLLITDALHISRQRDWFYTVAQMEVTNCLCPQGHQQGNFQNAFILHYWVC